MDKKTSLFTIIACLFVACLLITNIAAQKLIPIGPFIFTGGILIFPFSYIFGDILTEVWGYAKSRLIIYIGLGCTVFMSLFLYLIVKLPPAFGWNNQQAFETVFGLVPRIVLGSMCAYFCGEFINSYVVSKLKLKDREKKMGYRFVLSTVFGESADTIVFAIIALYGVLPNNILITTIWSAIVFKTVYEIVMLPFTIRLTKWLKLKTQSDKFDDDVNYNPFKITQSL
jgi:queuosine precursor transporter